MAVVNGIPLKAKKFGTRAGVGWYQIRKALQARNVSGDFAPISFKPFEEAYKALTENNTRNRGCSV